MEHTGLEAMLTANRVSLAAGEGALYETLRFLAFQQVCEALRGDPAEYVRWLNTFRRLQNPAGFARAVTEEYCGYRLDEASNRALGQWFLAFFRKSDVRLSYSESTRKALLKRQRRCCGICGAPITGRAELDHIVPWIYVGDELADNLQLLCRECNRRKRISPLYQLRMLLRSGR